MHKCHQSKGKRARCSAGVFFGSIAERVQPRYYSISSSPKAHPRAVHITCSVVRERKGTGRLHRGLASTWLGGLPPGAGAPPAPAAALSAPSQLFRIVPVVCGFALLQASP